MDWHIHDGTVGVRKLCAGPLENNVYVVACDRTQGAVIIDAADDAYVGSDLVPDVAERLGAETLRLDGHGHWWMMSAPDAAASGLVAFWEGLDG